MRAKVIKRIHHFNAERCMNNKLKPVMVDMGLIEKDKKQANKSPVTAQIQSIMARHPGLPGAVQKRIAKAQTKGEAKRILRDHLRSIE